MKISALFKAPLNYLPGSASPAKKGVKATDKVSPAVKKTRSMQAAKPVQLKPYRGIAVVFEESACDAVKALKSERYLVSERDAPMLPLPGCDASTCDCKYKHYDDRREDDYDRRHTAALRTEFYEDTGKENRRDKKRGRRKTDS